jgi:Ca-activated chloride channel family protein
VLFITDGFDTQQIDHFRRFTSASDHQVLLLTVGTTAGGPLRNPDGSMQTDLEGRPLQAALEKDSLQRLASDADVPIASLTLDDDDIEWVQRRAQHHLKVVEERSGQMRWKEFGYYLSFPLALLGVLWFRRGWVVRWAQ